MWFGVLGSLKLSGDTGDPIALNSGQPQRLLAVLLSRANGTVSTDRLIEALWSDAMPAAAKSNVQVYIHRLRRILGSDRIVYGLDGYRLIVAPDELDTIRFEALSAAGSFREALALWRGDPYAGFADLDLVREEIDRLTELRTITLEERIEDDLEQGRHTRLVGELSALVVQHPLRERLRGQLMLALHRSGRTPEALEVFQETRQQLVTDLGVEPGRQLQLLQQAILSGDRSLDLESVLAVGRRQPQVPAELPTETGNFTGRRDDLDHIRNLLTKGDGDEAVSIIAMPGPGGIGKSALAIHAAHRVAENYPDGQLYVNLQGATPGLRPLGLAEVLGRLLRSLGTAASDVPTGIDEASGRLRTLTAGRRILFVLDDAVDDAQVRPLLPGGSRSAVLVTSRTVLAGLQGAVHHHLDRLSSEEAVALLANAAGPERINAEADAAYSVAELCDFLPLALSLAAAKLARRGHWPIQTLADRMTYEQDRLDELESTDRAVRASFAVSYDDLGPEAARLFRLVGLLDGRDIGAPVAAALLDRSESEAESLLDELLDAQLATSYQAGRYHLHDLLRLFAREQAVLHDTSAEREAAVRRAVHFYLATALNAERVQTPDSWRARFVPQPLAHPGIPLADDGEIGRWLALELDNLIAVAQQGAASPIEGPIIASAFAAALFSPLNTRGRWSELRTLIQFGLQQTETTEYEDRHALLLTDLGWIYALLGVSGDAVALIKPALDHWQQVGDRRGETTSLRILAGALRHQGRLPEALEVAELAFKINCELGLTIGQIDCLIAIGLLHGGMGHLDDALAAYERGLAIGGPHGNLWHTGVLVGNSADLHRRAGKHTQAVPEFERALELDRTTGNAGTYFEAEHLWGLGASLHELGNRKEARRCWDRSATLLRELRLIGDDELNELMTTRAPAMPEVIARQL